ncbi:MAG TPA: hypothetical protein VF147_08640 [Vicinamibacterales bacterium]
MPNTYSLVLFAHVVAAFGLVGHSMGAPLIHRNIRTAPTASALSLWVGFARDASKWNPLVAIALLASGIYLGSLGWWTQEWFYVAVGGWVVNCALAVGVLQRTGMAIAKAAATSIDGRVPAEAERLRQSKGWAIAHAVMMGNDLALLYMMFNKPELGTSLAIVAIANALTVGVTLARHGSAAPATTAARSREAVV